MAISTRGASACVRKTPTGLPDCTSSVSSASSWRSGRDDAVEALPVARGAADAAVDDELAGLLRHVGIEVVHQHPQRRLGEPALGGDVGAVRRADHAGVVDAGHDGLHRLHLPAGGRAGIRSTLGEGHAGGGDEAPERDEVGGLGEVGREIAVVVEMGHVAAQARAHALDGGARPQRARGSRSPGSRSSSSMPRMCARFSAIGSKRRAACAAIETWSSWLAEVGIESMQAGCGALLVLRHERRGRHLRDHEAGVEARLRREERRQPRQRRVDQHGDAPLGDARRSRRWRAP